MCKKTMVGETLNASDEYLRMFNTNINVEGLLGRKLNQKYLNMVFDDVVTYLAPNVYKQMLEQMSDEFREKYKTQRLRGKIKLNDDELVEEIWREQFKKLKEQKLIGNEFENWRECYEEPTNDYLFDLSKKVFVSLVNKLFIDKKTYKESVISGEQHIDIFSLRKYDEIEPCEIEEVAETEDYLNFIEMYVDRLFNE